MEKLEQIEFLLNRIKLSSDEIRQGQESLLLAELYKNEIKVLEKKREAQINRGSVTSDLNSLSVIKKLTISIEYHNEKIQKYYNEVASNRAMFKKVLELQKELDIVRSSFVQYKDFLASDAEFETEVFVELNK